MVCFLKPATTHFDKMSTYKSTINVLTIQKKLSELISFIAPYHDIFSSHVVDFYTCDLWCNIVPSEIRHDVCKNKSIESIKKLFIDTVNGEVSITDIKNYPNIADLFKNANEISVRVDQSCLIKVEHLLKHLANKSCPNAPGLRLKEFMSEKKSHEVQVMSEVISALVNNTNVSHITDVGGGKGYLSSILALYNNMKVLGIDCSNVTTCGAIKRANKLNRLWPVMKKKYVPEPSQAETGVKTEINNLYKQRVSFVTPETDVANLVAEEFGEECTEVALIGLHTCGNLAPTSLKLFVQNNNISTVANVGCCYHLMSEKFDSNSFWYGVDVDNLDNTDPGFPMSTFLTVKKYSLGRNARMLASHALDRFETGYKDCMRSIFYRSVFQVFLKNYKHHTLCEGHVGKIAAKSSNFIEYVEKAVKKLQLNISVDEYEVTNLYDFYLKQRHLLETYFLLRISLAPVIESIILLDRLLFLHEQGVREAHLVQLFEPSKSPRCFGLVAWKDG